MSVLRLPLPIVLLLALLVPITTNGQRIVEDDDWCHDDWNDSKWQRHCEVREFTLDAREDLKVDAEPNGGISVHGWDRDEIRVRARVTTSAKRTSEALDLAERVEIVTGNVITASGPRGGRHSWYSVSFEIYAPTNTNLDLRSNNGGIAIEDISSQVRLETLNGGIALEGVSGDVRGRTTNGGVSVDLDGDRWQGRGLDVTTTNGGVRLRVPRGYSADLETSTVNGRVHIDFPVTVQGSLNRELSTTLGEGGATIRIETTNGGVHIARG